VNVRGFMYLVTLDMVRHVSDRQSPDCMQAKGGVCMCG
jgi:hypothetical protein